MERDALELPLPPRRRVYVRLEDIPDPDGDPRGLRTRLKPPSACTLRLAKEWQEDTLNIDLLYQLGGSLLPELSGEQLELLTVEGILRILELASQPIAQLEQIAKNGSAPLAEAPKGSNSATPSPTRSRKSRKATGSGSAA
jgi:hypothetical protein